MECSFILENKWIYLLLEAAVTTISSFSWRLKLDYLMQFSVFLHLRQFAFASQRQHSYVAATVKLQKIKVL